MNRCRSDGGKQPRVIRCSKGEYGLCRKKFALLLRKIVTARRPLTALVLMPVRSKTRRGELGLSFWRKRFSWLHFSAVEAADVAKWQTQRT